MLTYTNLAELYFQSLYFIVLYFPFFTNLTMGKFCLIYLQNVIWLPIAFCYQLKLFLTNLDWSLGVDLRLWSMFFLKLSYLILFDVNFVGIFYYLIIFQYHYVGKYRNNNYISYLSIVSFSWLVIKLSNKTIKFLIG